MGAVCHGLIAVTVFLGFGVVKVDYVKCWRQVCWGLVTNIRFFIGFIVCGSSWVIRGCLGIIAIAMTIKMSGVIRIFVWVGEPGSMIRSFRMWQDFRGNVSVTNWFTASNINDPTLGKLMMISIVAAMVITWGAAVKTIIIMAITAARATVQAARWVTALSRGALIVVNMVSWVRITITMWWQIQLASWQGRKCTRFWMVSNFT